MWYISCVVLAALSVSMVSGQDPRYISCVVLAALSMSVVIGQDPRSCTDYHLTNETNCNCSDVRCGQEIKCLNVNLTISRETDVDTVKLTCKNVISAPITLPTLRLGWVKLLELEECLPTAVSIRDIMVHLGVVKFLRLTINDKVDSLAKGQLADLTDIVRLGGLGLTHIDQDIFVDQNTTESAIRSLYLGRNNITHLDDTVFMKLKELQDLNLADNQLTTLPDDLFVNNKNLRVLVLGYNKLHNISSELFRNQEKLRMLFLSDNQLTHLEGEWPGLGSLTYLDLSNNQLTNMGDGTESVLRNVGYFGMTLILNNNNLTRVYPDWLEGGKEVYLKNNNIQTLKMDGLSRWTFNLTLSLVGNNITDVDIDVSDPYIDRLELHLKDNPLTCNCHLLSLALSKPFERVVIKDSGSITCGGPPNLKGRLVKDLTMEELNCTVSEGH